MPNHHEEALAFLDQAERNSDAPTQEFATIATAHGILALIELIQNEIAVGDQLTDPHPYEISIGSGEKELIERNQWQYEKIQSLNEIIDNLEKQLDGARAVARNHEITIETQQRILERVTDLAEKWKSNKYEGPVSLGYASSQLRGAITGNTITITSDGKDTNG